MEDYDIPPLEDMSEVIMRNKKSFFKKKEPQIILQEDSVQKSVINAEYESSINNSSFGGFKKGFLSSSTKNKNEPIIPFITAKKENPLKLKELNMDDMFKQHQDSIVELVEKDEYLCEKFLDPKFNKAFEEFKSNPKMAMMKYKDDQDLMLFMQKFSNILGNHFESLSNSKNIEKNNTNEKLLINKTTNKHIDKEVQDILNNDELKNILLDKEVKNFIDLMKENPNKAQSLLYSKDANFKQKINKLVQSGLMQFK